MLCVILLCFVVKLLLFSLFFSFMRKKKDGKSLKFSLGKSKFKLKVDCGYLVSIDIYCVVEMCMFVGWFCGIVVWWVCVCVG